MSAKMGSSIKGLFTMKKLRVRITTMEADLDGITLEPRTLGRDLFDTACRILGLREAWYFGLSFLNAEGLHCWLQFDKKIAKQGVPVQEDGSFQFFFLVKFYPENVDEELVQDVTRHLFFLQTKHNIITMKLYCQAEAAVLLASYAVQALYGDCAPDDGVELDVAQLLPKATLDQYEMTADMWIERIRKWWANNAGHSVEEAEIEYLRIAQDLDMFGIQYYSIVNQNETDLLLGVSPQGMGFYRTGNRLSPQTFFHWKELQPGWIQVKHGTQFVATTTDQTRVKFHPQHASQTGSILEICVGTQILFRRRQQPDNLEIQQLKIQAEFSRKRRMKEQGHLQKEREQRILAETERESLKSEVALLKEQLASMQDMVRNYEETNKLIAEKARLSEKEALELAKRASKAEAEVQRIKLSQLKAEENKITLERKVRDAELVAHRLLHQDHPPVMTNGNGGIPSGSGGYRSNGGQQQAPPPPPPSYNEFAESYVAGCPDERILRAMEQQQQFIDQQQQRATALQLQNNTNNSDQPQAHHQQMNAWRLQKGLAPAQPPSQNAAATTMNARNSQSTSNLYKIQQQPGMVNKCCNGHGCGGLQQQQQNSGFGFRSQTDLKLLAVDPRATSMAPLGVRHLCDQLEQTRTRYYARNNALKEQLGAFRAQLEALKKENKLTSNDHIFAAKFQLGFDRQSTLRKSGAGTPSKRAQIVDGL